MGVSHSPPSTTARPQSCGQLFWAFSWLALQGFGGVVAIVQREVVERRRWLSNEEFLEDWAVAQTLPGPNVVNLSLMIGGRYLGLRGALAALAGMIVFPLLLLLLLSLLYAQWAAHPAVSGALRGMGAVAAGMVAGTAFKLAAALHQHPLGWSLGLLLAGLTFTAMALWHWPLAAVLPVLGGTACALTWHRITP